MSNFKGFNFEERGEEMMTDLFTRAWRLTADGAGKEEGIYPPKLLRDYLGGLEYRQRTLIRHSLSACDVVLDEIEQRASGDL
jgi:hypothetical protein